MYREAPMQMECIAEVLNFYFFDLSGHVAGVFGTGGLGCSILGGKNTCVGRGDACDWWTFASDGTAIESEFLRPGGIHPLLFCEGTCAGATELLSVAADQFSSAFGVLFMTAYCPWERTDISCCDTGSTRTTATGCGRITNSDQCVGTHTGP